MATEYISREAAIETLKSIAFNHWFECGEYVGEESMQISVINADKAFEAIEAVPAADVVEVVRCKNCAFWNKEDSQPNGCLCEHWSGADALWYTPHDSFCSDGLKVVEIDQVKEGAE